MLTFSIPAERHFPQRGRSKVVVDTALSQRDSIQDPPPDQLVDPTPTKSSRPGLYSGTPAMSLPCYSGISIDRIELEYALLTL